MKLLEVVRRVSQPLGKAISIDPKGRVAVRSPEKLRQPMEDLVRTAVFGGEPDRGVARWLIHRLAIETGAVPASIHDLYVARGKGQVPDTFTVPAMNLRALAYHAARAVFRAAASAEAGALIFEIARSEMGYTDQRPAEYASCILGAALAEGFRGPVFIQGDHFQVSLKRYTEAPESELKALRDLAQESIRAGFYNIDIDTSTLVDLKKPSISEQQHLNFTLCAQLTAAIRSMEPSGVTVSVGGEIGEVGGRNSTEPELRAFMQGYLETLAQVAPGAVGLSKVSIQTGTTHGGVVLPDGSIAQVQVDFDTLSRLSRLGREEFGLGGAVQHGASTLPLEAFSHFVDAGTCEVHLATYFQNMLFERLPQDLRAKIYAYLDKNYPKDRKPDMSDEQFYYKTRKYAVGPFKADLWNMPSPALTEIEGAWEEQFRLLFDRLGIAKTAALVQTHVKPAKVLPRLSDYVAEAASAEDASDLAD